MTAGIGTPYFSSPEQLARMSYDKSVDVWAFGCVLICIYSDNRSPYSQSGAGGVLSRVMLGKSSPVKNATLRPPPLK